MVGRTAVTLVGTTVVLLSCTRAPATPAPVPSTTAPSTGAAAAANAQTAGPPRRVPPSRDSLEKLRAGYMAKVMQDIAGRESQPAEQVFKNVQVLKGITAAELVTKMDKDYATAMSWNCTNCHRLANQGNWASDTSNDKVRARFMQRMQNEINTVTLPKLYPRDTPKVTCATCHRGYNEPPPATYLIPERGKPGGLPFPPARGTPPPAETNRPPSH